MNKLLPTIITSLILCFTALTFPAAHAYAIPSLTFDKTSLSVAQDTTFTVTININVDTNAAQSSAATIQYAPADLDVVQVANANFFPSLTQVNDATGGVLEITGYTTSAAGVTANGGLATVTFKSKKGAGTSQITFACNGSYHDTNILTPAGNNILSCAQTNALGLTYTGGTAANTPTPTLAAGVPTPTPVQTNNTVPVCAGLSASTTSGVGSPLPVVFSCSGVDTDGYINAAYFDFGDGMTDTIEKNVGSPGVITTTHTYTTIGTLGASCKVRDNNQVWSQVPAVCKTIITIRPKPTVINNITYVTTQTNQTVTPTPQVVTLVYETPSPIASPTAIPSETPSRASQNGLGQFWWLIGSVAAIVIGAVIYMIRRPQAPPMPPMTPPTVPLS